MKIKIAVCISGLIRHLDITSKIFEYWNSLYDEIEFVFFLSGWKNLEQSENNFKLYIKTLPYSLSTSTIYKEQIQYPDFDFSKYKFLTDYETLCYDDIPKLAFENISKRKWSVDNTFLYSYALYRVHELRRKYGEKFDCVIQVREDVFVPKPILDKLYYYNVTLEKKYNPKVFFAGKGLYLSKVGQILLKDESFNFGSSLVMDEYSNMFRDSYLTSSIPDYLKEKRPIHPAINARQLIENKIYVHTIFNKLKSSLTKVIRTNYHDITFVDSRMMLKSELQDIIEKHGVEFLYSKDYAPNKYIIEVLKSL